MIHEIEPIWACFAANASKLGNRHTNYLPAIKFSCLDVVIEVINK